MAAKFTRGTLSPWHSTRVTPPAPKKPAAPQRASRRYVSRRGGPLNTRALGRLPEGRTIVNEHDQKHDPEIEDIFREFPRLRVEAERREKEFQQLADQDLTSIGRVLRGHLLVEHFLRRFLLLHLPVTGSSPELDVRFFKLIKLTCGAGSPLERLYAPLSSLNSIRNRFAHRLSPEIVSEHMAEIDKFLDERFNSATLAGLSELDRVDLTAGGAVGLISHCILLEELKREAARNPGGRIPLDNC